MDPLPPPDSSDPFIRAAKRKTLFFLVIAMGLMGLAGLGIALATVKFRRNRDIPTTLLAESALLELMPDNSRQVVVCKPGWWAFSPMFSPFPEAGRLVNGEKRPLQWAAGYALQDSQAVLVADWPESLGARTAPPGWQPSENLWMEGNPPAGKSGLPAGLNLMVRGRIGQNPDQVRVWAAALDISWPKGWGQHLWNSHPQLSAEPDLASAFANIKNWVTWIESQPDRVLLRAELECPDKQQARALEKILESHQAAHPELWSGFRFLSDGPWVSLQAPLGLAKPSR